MGDGLAALAVIIVAAAIGEGAIFLRPDLTVTPAFIFGDQAYSLFVAGEVFRGARLYQDVAYQYGWLPLLLYRPFAATFGNTPIVYLHFLLVASLAGAAAVYALVRRVLSPASACLLTVLGVVPVFVLPGSLLGGYTSAFYMPVERLAIVLAALAWQHPAQRTVGAAARLGAMLAVMQTIRFGPGLVLCAVILGFDAALLAFSLPPGGSLRASLTRWLRLAAVTCGVLLAGEALMAAVAFILLSRPIAADVLWPIYMQYAYPAAALRWPAWGGMRLLIAQYFNPLAGIILTCAAAWATAARKDRSASLLLPPLLFVAGAFTFLKTDHHFRQFAWMFAVGAAPAFARFPRARPLAVAAWLPVFAVVIRSATGPGGAGVVDLTTPNGWRLVTTPPIKARIEGIAAAVRTVQQVDAGPVMFYPNGSGFYAAYGVPHVSRQTWFFAQVVRPYELATLAGQYRSLRAVVSCAEGAVFTSDLPAEVREPLLRRLGAATWRDGECAVYPLSPPATR